MKPFYRYGTLLLAGLLIAGCSVKKPEDPSDAKASAEWIQYTLKKAPTAGGASAQCRMLMEAYEHAAQVEGLPEELAGQLAGIPKQVYALSMKTKELDNFKWALAKGVPLDVHYNELLRFWKLGPDWRELVMEQYTELALPIFMSQAAESYNVAFFDQYIGAFKQTGYKVKSPLAQPEFNVQFCRFIAEEIDEAVAKKDNARIEFLMDHMPSFPSVLFVDAKTKRNMKALGDYLLLDAKNEPLACKLIALGYELNPIKLSELTFGDAFIEALRADPDYAFNALRLTEWNGTLSTNDTDFVLTLPLSALGTLHKNHLDEVLERSMKVKNTETAMQLIALRSDRYPPTQSTYTELINWSLAYGNSTVFDFVMENNEQVNIFTIDFSLLARNQELFLKYAPMVMQNVYFSMDTHPRKDGTTIGQIKSVFASENELAGLYLVHKYNLAAAWVEATQGRTLLMDVCEAGNLKAARYLIEKRGQDVHAETGYSEIQISIFGSTRPTEGKLSPIFFAAKSGNSELIKYLVTKGADINARSNFGTTPLMHAVSNNHLEAVKTLLGMRAYVNQEMYSSLNQTDLRAIGAFDEVSTAYRRAKSNGNKAILEVLVKAGARP